MKGHVNILRRNQQKQAKKPVSVASEIKGEKVTVESRRPDDEGDASRKRE